MCRDMIYTDLYKKDNYLSPYYPYIINSIIRDYDISKANISILRKKGIFSQEQYEYYYNLPKKDREIQVGLYLRDHKEHSKELSLGFKECRQEFFDLNDIKEYEVLSIEKDSVKLINKIPQYTELSGGVVFVNKDTYTSFYNIKVNKRTHYRYFYSKDIINNTESIEIRGIARDVFKDIVYPRHKDYLLDFLYFIFDSAITDMIDDTVKYLTQFINKYITFQLEVGYYRELNRESKFSIAHKDRRILADIFTEDNKKYLDITFNLNILNTLLEYYSTEYFNRKKFR